MVDNVKRMKVDIYPCCLFCDEHRELVVHALFTCRSLRGIWFKSEVGLRVDLVRADNTWDWLKFLLDWEEDRVSYTFNLLHVIRARRNIMVFNRVLMDEDQTFDQGRRHYQPELVRAACCCPPDEGKVKVNNHRGEVLVAAMKWINYQACEVRLAEALGLAWALLLSLDLCFRQISIETNGQEISTWWKRKPAEKSYFHYVLLNGVSLARLFDSFALNFVLRNLNKAADCLATLTLDLHECG
ncbi:hypothetical protein RJT34_09406 [Clitoria ternatea]|uniref:RNase H type-1 domain-containing protein n=1 Tax=Clitoria ternatea TaxID=43366 RepID=A0AAN9K5R3_CLITE